MSRPPLIRQGEGQQGALNLHHERIQERDRYLKLVANIQAELTQETQDPKRISRRSAPADPQRLRAIPVIAPSITGTIPGTNPEQAVIAKEEKHLRNIR